MANSNVVRVRLPEDVNAFVTQWADVLQARKIIDLAVDMQERDEEITLPDALRSVGLVAAGIEEMYARLEALE